MPDDLHRGDKFIRKRRQRSRWHKVMVVLSSIVVFCTTYALILPAITMEKGCQLPEHTHDESCYETQSFRVLDCQATPHQHTESCRDENGDYTCGYANFWVHTHDASCYDEGTLVCTLPEIREHSHTEDCYVLQVHEHGETCYERTRGDMICDQEEMPAHHHDDSCSGEALTLTCDLEETEGHTHTEECYVTTSVLTCEKEGSEDHAHGEDCYTEETVLSCGQVAAEPHTHTEDCYSLTQRVCEMEETEGHAHDDGCWEWEEILDCDIPEEEWVTICGKEEIVLHTHTDDCFDENGSLVCGKPEVRAHVHDENCYREEEKQVRICPLAEHTHDETCQVAEETSTYYCGKEVHTHGETCYDEGGELTCEQEEHTHTDDCQIPPETEPEPAYECGREPHTHGEGCYDEDGNLTCTMEEHVHSDDCLPKTYYCGRRAHVHDETCLDEAGERVCGLEEHTHTDRCLLPIPYCGKEEHTHTEECYNEDGNLICLLEIHTHTPECFLPTLLTEAEREALLGELTRAVEGMEALEGLTDEDITAAQELLSRLDEAYRQRWLEEEAYLALYDRVEALLRTAYDSLAEPCYGNNWRALANSGWFYAYSGLGVASYSADDHAVPYAAPEGDTSPSSVQIDEPGGANKADDVTVSKTIAGTDIENVFDITLTVQTPQKIDEVISEPDMAVVIVMDISNTMNEDFGGMTRYAAAVSAAEDFLDKFAENNTLGVSKVGYVAFNTNAHQIFRLSPCTNETQANSLKNTMRTQTGSIINNYEKDAYGNTIDRSRFTNIEAGLKMAQDMLRDASNKNKFIILLTDGFPTTYVSSGYSGYDTYDVTGAHFYDHVVGRPCRYGISYSDTAAIKAREMAESIKSSGTTIFSIGVDVGGQKIQTYINQSTSANAIKNNFSVVDRKSETYDIGGAEDPAAYRNWLCNSIGSGYYYDSTNTAGLKDAYTQIFAQIKTTIETATAADWVASDPIPSITPDEIDFIGLFDKDGVLQGESLKGTHEENAEDTANYADSKITWDLKQSGYTRQNGSQTIYSYELKYRIRLRNEDSQFVEGQIYKTNGTTTLQYRVIQSVNGTTTISDSKTINFPIPSVHGYLGELEFQKVDNYHRAVPGAEFTLHHADTCKVCRGNGTRVDIADQVVKSGDDGKVTFTNIPSGHTYTLTETGVPPGYATDGSRYTVTVAYDEVTVTVTDSGGNEKVWDGTIVNNTAYELPATGGPGTIPYTLGGTAMALAAAVLLYHQRKRRKEEASSI